MMYATSSGIGPWKPAIKLNGRLWVLDKVIDNQDYACEIAAAAVDVAMAAAVQVLIDRGFMPTAEHG